MDDLFDFKEVALELNRQITLLVNPENIGLLASGLYRMLPAPTP